MTSALTIAFLKIFFRNWRAMFFVIGLPAGIFLVAAFLGLEQIIRFEGGVSYIDFLLTGVIALALMQTGIYTVAYSLVDWRRTKVLKRLFVTPLTTGRFLWTQSLARFVIALVQTAVLVIIAVAIFETKFNLNIIFLPIIIFLGSTLFLAVGFLIASLARDYEEAAPYTSMAGITLTFLGDVFFPVDNLPYILSQIASWLPMKPLAALMRYSMLGIKPENLSHEILVLLLWLGALSLITPALFRKRL